EEVVVGVESAALVVGVRTQQAPGLGREDELVARLSLQESPEAPLRQPETVMRGGVEVADAGVPRRFEHGPGLVVTQLAEQVADIRRTVSEGRQPDRRVLSR